MNQKLETAKKFTNRSQTIIFYLLDVRPTKNYPYYNKILQKWLDNNNNLISSRHNEGKSVIPERFIKT